VADTVPRRFSKAGKAPENGHATAPLPVRSHAGSEEGSMNPKTEVDQAKGLVSRGAPSGTRTPNPLIKSQLLCLLS
jgi:hypothetical protein